jgi:hypothetical protein
MFISAIYASKPTQKYVASRMGPKWMSLGLCSHGSHGLPCKLFLTPLALTNVEKPFNLLQTPPMN